MKDIIVEEVETEDLEAYVKQFLTGSDVHCEKTIDNGTIMIWIWTDVNSVLSLPRHRERKNHGPHRKIPHQRGSRAAALPQ
jgi:hypothetical protein